MNACFFIVIQSKLYEWIDQAYFVFQSSQEVGHGSNQCQLIDAITVKDSAFVQFHFNINFTLPFKGQGLLNVFTSNIP